MSADYYAVLQLPPNATQEEVHRAYRAMALRHHPDRNPSPEAAATMAVINEAYAVLGESGRRRRYDRERVVAIGGSHIAAPILAAARDAVIKQRWTILLDEGSRLVLEKGKRRVGVLLIEKLTDAALRKLGRQWTEFLVILTIEIETPLNMALNAAVIDLLHSQRLGADFPDDSIRTLFACFLGK